MQRTRNELFRFQYGESVYYHEWSRPLNRPENIAHETKTLFCLFFTMKQFAIKMDPLKCVFLVRFSPYCSTDISLFSPFSLFRSRKRARRRGARGYCNFHAFRTNNYKFHFFETITGLRMILITEPGCADLREHLKRLHESSYVGGVLKRSSASANAAFESRAFRDSLLRWAASL